MASAPGSLGAFVRKFTVDTSGMVERDAKALLVQTAAEGNKRILAEQTKRSGGATPGVATKVDGTEGKPLDQVRMPGIIRFDYDYRWEVALWLLSWLQDNSPVDSGEYRGSHVILLNGKEIAPDPSRRLYRSAELLLTNTTPYSRRLEVATKKDGSPFVVQVQPGIYGRGVKAARAEFSGLIGAKALRVDPLFLDLAGAYQPKGGDPMRYPAAQVKLP